MQVYKAIWQGQTVAVKVCRQEYVCIRTMKQFQKEVAILNDCSHRNVVEFIGACCWKVGPAPLDRRETTLESPFGGCKP